MPARKCTKNGKPGYKWGKEGACYPYTPGDKASRDAAYSKAVKQGQAIKASQGEK
jgi:hypothetical protein